MATDLQNAIATVKTALAVVEAKATAAAPGLVADAKAAADKANETLSQKTGPIRGWVLAAICAASFALGWELSGHIHGAINWE